MDCTDLRLALVDGVPSGQEVDAHVAVCPPCAELVADDAALASALVDIAETIELNGIDAALLKAIEVDNGPVAALRKIPSWMHGVALIAVVMAIAAMQAVTALRADYGTYPPQLMGLVLAALGGPIIGLSIAATRPLYKAPLPSGLLYGLTGTALTIPLILAALPAPHGHLASDITGLFLPATIACFGMGTLTAALVLIVHRLLDRRSHPDRNVTLLVALVGTVAGAIALQIHCPFTDNAHMLLGHASQGVLFAGAIYALFNSRRTRRR
jgi:hypothetical protein